MNTLDAVLQHYTAMGPQLGAKSFSAADLRRDLAALTQSNGRYFAIIFAVFLVLLLLAVLLLARYLGEPAKAGAVLAASGLSIPFLLRTMLRMWEVKTNTEALMHLAATLEGDTLRSVVKVFAESVVKNRRW